jgi:hypothetical protein
MSDSATIVQKLWNYCNVLRDDGLSYQDYIRMSAGTISYSCKFLLAFLNIRTMLLLN